MEYPIESNPKSIDFYTAHTHTYTHTHTHTNIYIYIYIYIYSGVWVIRHNLRPKIVTLKVSTKNAGYSRVYKKRRL